MSINLGFSDILLIDEFKGLKEFDLLDIKMDVKVLPYLHKLGLDSNQGYEIVAHKYRNLQNKVVTGFLYAGEIRCDAEFKKSPFCTLMDRVIMSSKRDYSLTQQLCTLMGGTSSAYSESNEDNESSGDEYLMKELMEDDYEQVSKQLEQLRGLILTVRGSPYSNNGGLRCHSEYLENVVK